MAQDRIVEVGTASETTKPVPQESTKPQVSEKADTKEIVSSEASHVQEEQLPNTGSAESQAALAAGLALLGLSAGLVATKGKKEDQNESVFLLIVSQKDQGNLVFLMGRSILSRAILAFMKSDTQNDKNIIWYRKRDELIF